MFLLTGWDLCYSAKNINHCLYGALLNTVSVLGSYSSKYGFGMKVKSTKKLYSTIGKKLWNYLNVNIIYTFFFL